VTDRRAEDHAVLRRDGQQGDLAVEADELLDDDPRPVAAHLLDGIVPGGLDLAPGTRSALALARARHHRLDDTGQADCFRSGDGFLAALRETVS